MPYKVLQDSVIKGIYFATLVNSFKKQYLCQKCNCTFTRKCYLALHMKSHGFKCADCKKSFVHKILLRHHIERIHQVPRNELRQTIFSCEKCKVNFETKLFLKMHLWAFHRDKYICPKRFCKKEFKTREEFIKHRDNHELRPCTFCGKKVKRHFIHSMIHYEDRYPCQMCKKNFRQYGNLRRHILIHLKLKPYSCAICKKSFTQRYNMIIHCRTHFRKKPFVCQLCEKDFVRSSSLKHHILAVHCGKEVRSFKCDECKFTTIAQWRLNEHKKKFHTEVFKCKICSAILKCQNNLERHLLTHREKKPFPCHHCIMEYATKAALTKHQKRCHLQR